MAADVHKERLATIGQIEVVIDRLITLQEVLLSQNPGNYVLTEEYNDAAGNVSFQTGALIGQMSNLQDAGRGQ